MKFPKNKYYSLTKFSFDYINTLNKVFKSIDLKALNSVTSLIEKKIKSNKNIFVCGNGGSAAIANHYLADYTKFLSTNTQLKPKINSLLNVELLTAISNDINFNQIFSYQLEKYANKDDLLILISSSGNSKNLKNALKTAKKKKIKIVSFVGFNGGFVGKNSTLTIHNKINNYGISEDLAHILMHIIAQFIRQKNLRNNIKKVKF